MSCFFWTKDSLANPLLLFAQKIALNFCANFPPPPCLCLLFLLCTRSIFLHVIHIYDAVAASSSSQDASYAPQSMQRFFAEPKKAPNPVGMVTRSSRGRGGGGPSARATLLNLKSSVNANSSKGLNSNRLFRTSWAASNLSSPAPSLLLHLQLPLLLVRAGLFARFDMQNARFI